MANKIIISCAITGSIHTPTMSDALPVTPDQIATQAIDAAKAGAAILHLHARDPKDGRPTVDPKVWMQYLPRLKEGCDAILNMSTGGPGVTTEEKLAAALVAEPEMATINVSSMTYGLFKKAEGFKDW